MSTLLKYLLCSVIIICTGCASSYVTPGEPANFADINREDIAEIVSRKPSPNFPARIAVIRIQAPNYVSYTAEGQRYGGFSIIPAHELTADNTLQKIQQWPQVTTVVPVSSLLIPANAKSIDDLRLAAAKLQADVLMIYTIDTKFYINNHFHASFSLLSLGMMPDRNANVTATATAIFTDVRTGFTYGTADATAKATGLTSAWSSDATVDKKRVEAEQLAFNDLIKAANQTWQGIVEQYDINKDATQ